MGGYLFVQVSRFGITFQYLPQSLPGQSLTAAVEKQSLLGIVVGQAGSGFFQVFYY
jgi:hypothetical protein